MGLVALGIIVGASACSATETTFKEKAADFIQSDTVTDGVGQAFTEAECDEPADTEVGTTFQCTATGADELDYTFVVEITAENEFTLTAVNASE
jgi:hypothetical protein